jgi:hypothetical protein
VILEVGADTWCVHQSLDVKRIEQVLWSDATELKQTRGVDRTIGNNDVGRFDEPSTVR